MAPAPTRGLLLARLGEPSSVSLLMERDQRAARGLGLQMSELVVLTDAWDVQEAARAHAVPSILIDTLLAGEVGDQANSLVLDIRDTWQTVRGEDWTVCAGVSLGQLFAYELGYAVLFPVIRELCGVSRAIDQVGPAAVATDEPPGALCYDVVAALGQLRGLPVRAFRPPRRLANLERHFRVEVRPNPVLSALRIGVKRARRGLASIVRGLRERAGPTAARRAVLFHYYPSVEPVLSEWAAQGVRTPILLDPLSAPPRRVLVPLLAAGASYLPSPRPDAAQVGTAVRALQQRWREWREAAEFWKSQAAFGVNLRPFLLPALDRFTHTKVPMLARQVASLRAAFATHDVACVVVPFDVSERARMLVNVAALHGAPSVVLQHGLGASGSLDCDKRAADHVLVWSEPVRRQLAQWGVDPARMHAVGNPGFDQYATRTLQPRHEARKQGSRPTVLVLCASPNYHNVRRDTTISERYLRLVLDGLRALETRPRVILRPHPSERPEFYRMLLSSWNEAVDEVAAGVPFAECIASGDVTISPTSTGALEAWLAGKQVIVISDCAWGVDYPLDGSAGIPAVAAPGPLAEAMAKALASPTREESAAIPASSPVREYCGPLDGQSALRALAFIDRLRRAEGAGASHGGRGP